MRKRGSAAVVGIFVLAAIALGVLAVALLGSGKLFGDTEEAIAYFDESVSGLLVGAPVKLMGITVGHVEDIRVEVPRRGELPESARVAVLMEIDEERMAVDGRVVDLGDPETLAGLIEEGLRASIGIESFVTGMRYVDLDFHPGTRVDLVARAGDEVPEVPTIPAETARLQRGAQDVVGRLAEVEYAETFESVRKVAENTNELLESPELEQSLNNLEEVTANLAAVTEALGPKGEIGRNLARATEQSAETSEAIGALVDPDGGLVVQLDETLVEVREAARSLRRLSDRIGRDPASLIRGGRR